MNRIILLVALSVIVNTIFAQKINFEVDSNFRSASIVPVVNYNPVNFKDHVVSSFDFNPNCDCLFKMRENETINLYWYSDYPHNQGFFTLTEISSLLPTKLEKLIKEKDSTFVFYPNINKYDSSYEFIPHSIRYLGYIENGELYYVNNEKSFDSLEQLVIDEFGSLNNFTQKYTEQINEALYSSMSGLYEFKDDTLAVKYLNGSYKFYALLKLDDDYEGVIRMFLDWLKTIFILSIDQEKKLFYTLCQSVKIDKEQMINDFLSGIKMHEPFDVNCLRFFFSTEELNILQSYLKEENIKIKNSYRLLRNQISNIDTTGYYYTDFDVLKFVFKKIY